MTTSPTQPATVTTTRTRAPEEFEEHEEFDEHPARVRRWSRRQRQIPYRAIAFVNEVGNPESLE